MSNLIFVINPGSTSTKIALYDGKQEVFTRKVNHTAQDLAPFEKIADQFQMRYEALKKALEDAGVDPTHLTAVVARGGNMKPVEGGVYEVNEPMKRDLAIGVMGQHPCNLGGLLADEIAKQAGGIPSYVVDPVVVDEFDEISYYSGFAGIRRKSKDHPLNQKAAARAAAAELGGRYESFNFVVAHLGGGISVGVHRKGRVIDVNDALSGDGPFSPERAGTVPAGSLVDLCFSGELTKEQIKRKLTGGGGLVGYLGTSDAQEVERRIAAGDEEARSVYEAMAYQIAREIGAGAASLSGEVDGVVLTGGLINSKLLQERIIGRVRFISRVFCYPGEFEMEALRDGVLRVQSGEEQPKIYA